MRKSLTDKAIEALKPQAKRYEVHDVLLPGLTLRVATSGHKTFNVKFRFGQKQRRQTLGTYPRLTLAKAREKAMAALRVVDEGIDPTGLRPQPDFFLEAVCAEFIRQYAKPRNRSWREAERTFQRELFPTLGKRDVRKIGRLDILPIMDAAMERDAAYQANRILAHTRKLFNWCVERGILEANPLSGLRAPGVEKSRDRVLNDAEIRRLLRACQNEAYPFRQFVPLLLATAQRRGELAAMRWSEIDLDAKQWVIPAERAKNGKPHVVPLSDYSLAILRETPRFPNTDYVLTTTRKTPISGFAKMQRRLSDEAEVEGWRLHDLRRTAATGMAQAAIPPHVVEKVLNHVSGSISGIAAVYNRWAYDAEKSSALDRWGNRLVQITEDSSVHPDLFT